MSTPSKIGTHPAKWGGVDPAQTITALFTIEVETPRGDALEFTQTATLPFIPRKGDWLVLGPQQDFWEVETVYWHADTDCGYHFHVYFVSPDGSHTKKYMESQGWAELEFNEPEQPKTRRAKR